MKNKYEIPKLKSRQQVYNHVCAYVQNIANFQLAEQHENGEQFIAFVGDNGVRSTLGCLFDAKKLSKTENTTNVGNPKLQPKVLKLLRDAHSLDKKQKIDVEFIRNIEAVGELLYHDPKCGSDWKAGKKDFIKDVRKLARDFDLTPYKFDLHEKATKIKKEGKKIDQKMEKIVKKKLKKIGKNKPKLGKLKRKFSINLIAR